LKPVGVLINANCYSSCDIFASYMQDSHAGVIYGEDPQTGAGGANVVQHKNFFTKYLPEVFQNMPGGQDMRIGWRQAIRSGKNAGKLIEDHGVYADFVVRPLASEFATNATRTNQLEKIVEHLKQYGEQTGKTGRTCKFL
jgi:C-terminal processing protease CtpA/Prc